MKLEGMREMLSSIFQGRPSEKASVADIQKKEAELEAITARFMRGEISKELYLLEANRVTSRIDFRRAAAKLKMSKGES